LQALGRGDGLLKGIFKKPMDPVTNDNGKVLEGVEDWSFIVLMANGLDLLRTR
jgi:hypothetical protein